MKCAICEGNFKESPDSVVLCNHLESPVHLGCCVDKCSMHKEPCENSESVYEKS